MSLSMLAIAVLAQAGVADLDCTDPQTQTAMNRCAQRSYQSADAELETVWEETLAYIQAQDEGGGIDVDVRPTGEAKLVEAQHAWRTYREAHCTVRGYEARGGSMESMLYFGCMAFETRQRIEELSALNLGSR